MVYIFAEDPHFYHMFKQNIIKYGTGKIVMSLYHDWEQLKYNLKSSALPVDILLIQTNAPIESLELQREIKLGINDFYDERGAIVELSLCRTFGELIELIAGELEEGIAAVKALHCKTYFGICDEGIPRLSMLQRLSSMAVQYSRQMMIIDLDLGGEVTDDIKMNSERVVFQLLNGGKVQLNSLVSKEHPNIFYFKPFNQIADTHLYNQELMKQLGELASQSGIEFVMALHKGSLSAPSLALGSRFDVCFALGTSFESERIRKGDLGHTEGIRFFSNTSTRQSCDGLTEWHMYMNGQMRSGMGGTL